MEKVLLQSFEPLLSGMILLIFMLCNGRVRDRVAF